MKFKKYRYRIALLGLFILGSAGIVEASNNSKFDGYIDSLKILIPQQDDTVKLVSIVELDRYLASSIPKEMVPYLEEGLEIANDLGHSFYQAQMLNLQGTAHYYMADYDEAKRKWKLGIDVFENIPEEEYYSEARFRLVHSTLYMNLGVISRMRGAYSQALDYYQKTLDIRKTTGYKTGIAACYINIGKVYVDNKNDERALEYYLKADAIFKEHPSKTFQAALLNNIGLIYSRQGQLEKAESYFSQSLEIYQQLELPKRVSQSYINLGQLYRDMNDCDQSLDYYSLALIINKDISDRLGTAWCYQYIGECYHLLDQPSDALNYYHKALYILEELKVASNQLACYKGLANVYADMANYEKAFYYKEKFVELSDSVYSEELTSKLAEQEARYATADKEKQLVLKDLEIERKTALIERNKLEKWALIIGFLLVVAIAIIFIQRFRIEARFHKKLESQNEELQRTYDNLKTTVISKEEKEIMIKEIHHRVKNNLQIISSLVNIQANTVEDNKVRHMFREVQNRIISMSLLHEQLYKAPDLSRVNVKEYLEILLGNLLKIYANDTNISVRIDVKVECFGVDTLIPIGLLVNEAVTNSLKYAFKNRKEGDISIVMKVLQDDRYLLVIADNGIGLATDQLDDYKESLGMELIQTFVSQLDGVVEIDILNGTSYRIEFYPLCKEKGLSVHHSSVPAA